MNPSDVLDETVVTIESLADTKKKRKYHKEESVSITFPYKDLLHFVGLTDGFILVDKDSKDIGYHNDVIVKWIFKRVTEKDL